MANPQQTKVEPVVAAGDIAAEARTLMRRALKASLATLDRSSGDPYASLVAVATSTDGCPVFLISSLARHTQNILNDSRVSVLFDGTGGLGDPLEGGRVSVRGRAEKTTDEAAQRRFLARHPSAAGYAGFGDFAFYRLKPDGAHFVGGFGRIHDLDGDVLLSDLTGADALVAAEAGVVEHMNEDHADAIRLYATRLLGNPPGPWRMTGCDPEGCDLVLHDRALRLEFPRRVTTPQEVREVLVALVKKARN